jgi:4-hydroxy-tetrahydrodipicolinate reductase
MQLVGGIVSEEGGHVGREIAPGILAFGADDMAKTLKDADVYLDATSASAVERNLLKICGVLAAVLEDYDVEIIETHHDKKKDAPSGTALKAAHIVSEVTGIEKMVYGRSGVTGARGKEIGIHSIRAGDVVGEHTIIFAGNKERIEFTHRAHSREAFAEGAVTAIRWVSARRDSKVHSMAEVLGL